jgi:hypothetical protein
VARSHLQLQQQAWDLSLANDNMCFPGHRDWPGWFGTKLGQSAARVTEGSWDRCWDSWLTGTASLCFFFFFVKLVWWECTAVATILPHLGELLTEKVMNEDLRHGEIVPHARVWEPWLATSEMGSSAFYLCPYSSVVNTTLCVCEFDLSFLCFTNRRLTHLHFTHETLELWDAG